MNITLPPRGSCCSRKTRPQYFRSAAFWLTPTVALEADGDPRDHEDIRGPMPLAVDRSIAFIDRNTRHPMKVVGLNRVRLDEYPTEALREALVNAVAHRQYEDAGRKIMLEVFSDRVVVSSPGLPPAPITLASLSQGQVPPLLA